MSRKRKFLSNKLLFYLLLSLGAFITVFPFLYMISTSLKGPVYVFEFPPRLIPEQPTIKNFITAWGSNRFDRYFLNSVVVTLSTTFLVVWLASMMAFALARLDFIFKKIIYGVVLFFMIMPAMTLIVPQFILATRFALIDKLEGLILLYVAQNLPLSVFLLRGFIEQIPREIEEAAIMDGASAWDIYRRIILPLSKPALATSIIFASLGAWDEYIWAFTIINDPSKRTLPVGIAAFHGVHLSDWGLVFAASLIAVAPILLFFMLMQRYFIKGVITGAVKG